MKKYLFIFLIILSGLSMSTGCNFSSEGARYAQETSQNFVPNSIYEDTLDFNKWDGLADNQDQFKNLIAYMMGENYKKEIIGLILKIETIKYNTYFLKESILDWIIIGLTKVSHPSNYRYSIVDSDYGFLTQGGNIVSNNNKPISFNRNGDFYLFIEFISHAVVISKNKVRIIANQPIDYSFK